MLLNLQFHGQHLIGMFLVVVVFKGYVGALAIPSPEPNVVAPLGIQGLGLYGAIFF